MLIKDVLITGSTALISLSYESDLIAEVGVTLPHLFKPIMFGSVHLILISISLSIGFIFFWMIFLMFTRFTGTFISFVATLIIALITGNLYSWLSSTQLYETITKWGEFKWGGLLKGFEFSIDESVPNISDVSVYAGSYVFEFLLALILFYAACWMLNRKNEV